jgi:hypothetical protein
MEHSTLLNPLKNKKHSTLLNNEIRTVSESDPVYWTLDTNKTKSSFDWVRDLPCAARRNNEEAQKFHRKYEKPIRFDCSESYNSVSDLVFF